MMWEVREDSYRFGDWGYFFLILGGEEAWVTVELIYAIVVRCAVVTLLVS